MCASPSATCFLTFFTCTSTWLSHVDILYLAYLRIGLVGPLRVRALVLVR